MINLLNDTTRYTVLQRIAQVLADNVWPLVYAVLGLLGAMGALYAIYLGVKLATAQDESKRKEAKARIIWTIIAIVIVFGLIGVFVAVNWEGLNPDNLPDPDYP